MFRTLLAEVRAEVSGERALADVRSLAAFHRVQSSPGYDDAAAWVADAARGAGLEVEVERAPGDGRTRRLGQLLPEAWECSHATASLIDGERRERIADYADEPLSLVLRSAPTRGRFRLVAVDDGASAGDYAGLDVRGAVVLGSAPAHRLLELAVRERGAAGILCDGRRLVPPVREAGTDVDSLAYTSFWWSGDEPRGWGFVVSPRRGGELRERLRSGVRLEIEVEIDSRRFAAPIPLVTATLAGARPDADEVLVLSHLCHPRPSANDNASGVAAALECGRALVPLARRGRRFARGIRFLWVPELTGTFAWLGGGAGLPGRADRLVAAVNLDMVGENQEACGSTFLMEHPPHFAASFAEELLGRIRAEAADWVTSYSGPGHYGLARMAEVPYSGGSDHSVFVDPAVGVPCPMLIQWPDRYYHSNLDTPEKCDPRSLALAARCAATYAGFLAGAGPAETAWLLGAVERGARRRLLAAADATDATRMLEREMGRGRSAIRSLSRLGAAAREIDAAADRLGRFAAAELPPAAPGPARDPRPADTRVPRRREPGPLDFLDSLLGGWEVLTREEREAWHAVRVRHPGPLFEVAWFACDGARDLAALAHLAWLETGLYEPEGITAFFEWTARLGQSDWAGGGGGA